MVDTLVRQHDQQGTLCGYQQEFTDSDGAPAIRGIPINPDNSDYVKLAARIEAEDPTLNIVDPPTVAVRWDNGRKAKVGDGGYGAITEQLEILGEQGIDAYQQHIAAVKAAHPKP
jgi:hypothetical protein|tara:strand:+ start:1558 stop:1902 length:345 start_codon:yes stop_codon:yes gene_type:complete